MCLLYNWKNYPLVVLLDLKQDCFLHVEYRALFQLESPGSPAQLYREIPSWEHIAVRQPFRAFNATLHLQNRCLRYGLASWPPPLCADLFFKYWGKHFENCIKTVCLIPKLIRELPKLSSHLSPWNSREKNLTRFGDEICLFKDALILFLFMDHLPKMCIQFETQPLGKEVTTSREAFHLSLWAVCSSYMAGHVLSACEGPWPGLAMALAEKLFLEKLACLFLMKKFQKVKLQVSCFGRVIYVWTKAKIYIKQRWL